MDKADKKDTKEVIKSVYGVDLPEDFFILLEKLKNLKEVDFSDFNNNALSICYSQPIEFALGIKEGNLDIEKDTFKGIKPGERKGFLMPLFYGLSDGYVIAYGKEDGKIKVFSGNLSEQESLESFEGGIIDAFRQEAELSLESNKDNLKDDPDEAEYYQHKIDECELILKEIK